MVDLRNWKPSTGSDTSSYVYGYRRLKVRKEPENTNNNVFRISVLAVSPDTKVRFPAQQLRPRLYSRPLAAAGSGDKFTDWDVGVDFQKVPLGEAADIIYEHISPGKFLRDDLESTTLTFEVEVETVELTRWLLLPRGTEYHSFRLLRYKTGKPDAPEVVKPVTQFVADDHSILAFKLLALKPGYTHEITWFYR